MMDNNRHTHDKNINDTSTSRSFSRKVDKFNVRSFEKQRRCKPVHLYYQFCTYGLSNKFKFKISYTKIKWLTAVLSRRSK